MVQGPDDWLMAKWKWFGRKRSWMNRGNVPAWIRTGHCPGTSHTRHCVIQHQENDMFKTEQHSRCWSASELIFVRTAARHNRTHTDPSALIQATFHFTNSSDSESIGAHRWVNACQIDWRPQLRDSSSNRLAPTAARFLVKSISAHSWVISYQIG